MAARSTQDPRQAYRQAVRAAQAADRLAHDTWDPRDPRPEPVSKRDVAVFLIGMAVVITFLVLFLALGPGPL